MFLNRKYRTIGFWFLALILFASIGASVRPMVIDITSQFPKTLHGFDSAALEDTRQYIQGVSPSMPVVQVDGMAKAIVALASKYSLNHRLILAVIRVESRFNESAVSPKGALGLMQIMPETGAWLSKLVGRPYRGPEDLLDPMVNLQLGVHYLSLLKKKYNKAKVSQLREDHYLLAYNLGPAALDKSLELGTDLKKDYSNKIYSLMGNGAPF